MEINGSNYDAISIFVWSKGKKEWGSEVISNFNYIYVYKEEKV